MLRKILLKGIRFYQRYISPMKTTKCPYYPTCSAYGYEAVERFGPFLGSGLALYRILRCNPFSHGGVDYVPQTKKEIITRYKIVRKK